MRIILMLFGGVAVLIVAGISYILLMSPQQMDEIAIITADERPYKVVPVNPGGQKLKIQIALFSTLWIVVVKFPKVANNCYPKTRCQNYHQLM